MDEQRLCENCNKPFKPKTEHQRYCCRACRLECYKRIRNGEYVQKKYERKSGEKNTDNALALFLLIQDNLAAHYGKRISFGIYSHLLETGKISVHTTERWSSGTPKKVEVKYHDVS